MVKIMIKVMVKGTVKIRDGIESRFAAFYLIELKTEHFIRTWKVTFCVTMRGLWTRQIDGMLRIGRDNEQDKKMQMNKYSMFA